jgi:hypothetical protein
MNCNIITNNERNIDYKDIQKMIFIFNAINDGWHVKKIDNNKFEFIKNNENKEIILEDFKKYINYNINN